jgi:hypothetical protein
MLLYVYKIMSVKKSDHSKLQFTVKFVGQFDCLVTCIILVPGLLIKCFCVVLPQQQISSDAFRRRRQC